MAIDTLRRLAVFTLLVLAQALVLSRIHLFGCATPLLMVYFIIAFPRSYPRWATLLWAFAMGLAVDVFANTPGVAAAALTVVGLLQPMLLEIFLPREAEPDIKASARSLGFVKFLSLALLLTVVFCLMFFALDTFTFFHWQLWLTDAMASALFTMVIILMLETFRT